MKLLKVFLWLVFVLYIAVLIKVILIKYMPISYLVQNLELGLNHFQMNFVPFATIINYIVSDTFTVSVQNILGNIVIFMPFGFLLPILISRFQKFITILLVSFCFSLTFEIIQLLFPILGSFDVDDLILNTLGALLGFMFFTLIKRLTQRNSR
ncbi:VanZ family protein [Oceanobacillus luteolus]|uniref:VanZ family protein n=1 Tax=Oceanobacillus luteolus TaxID=1274358 RepID=A0ABW4HS18_9BACI|nr:VanZ family protein [Oceanobacillus luteolus]MCM3742484.1 VanZ family protein [Oceanobacillus luteolus]